MIRSYRQLDMQNLEILNMTLEKLAVDPVSPGEGRIWFSNESNLPRIRADGQNRFLVAPDDDFNASLPLKDTLYINDTLLIYDIEHDEYRRIKASVILDQMSTVKDVFKTIHSEYGVTSIVASGADNLYFTSDGDILKTTGSNTGTKQVKYEFRDQFNMMVLAGPLDVVSGKPTFRHLTDGDLPSSYNPANWNAAYDFSQIIVGNPSNVTMEDLGYSVVTTIGDPGLDENLPTEKATRVAIDLAVSVLEPALGNPSVTGYFLSSTDAGVRSWVNIPASSISSIESDMLSATELAGVVSITAYDSADKDDGRFYWGTTSPTNTKRLNYDGKFYSAVLTATSDIYIGIETDYSRLASTYLEIIIASSQKMKLDPAAADGAEAVAYIFNTNVSLVTEGANLFSIRNNSIEKFYVDKDGEAYANGVHLGGGEILYTNAATTPTTLGGIAAGSTFVDQTMQEMWDAFLYPYQVPTFYSFGPSNRTTIYECGIDFGGTLTFVWSSTNPGNINTNTVVIRDETNATDILTSSANDGAESIDVGSIIKNTTGQTQQWSISAINSHSDAVAKSYFTITSYNPFYYGVGAAALTVANIQMLTKQVVAKSNKTYSFSPSSQKFYFAYPASYGYLTSIKDPNGFDITSSFTVRTESFTNNGTYFYGTTTSYYVYESNDLTTQTSFSITFNF